MYIAKNGGDKWMDGVSNKEVLKNQRRTLSETFKRRRDNWIGHIIRGKVILTTVF